MENELKEFPLRMRDWLKNVLVTLYERDEDNNLLTEKQKLRVGSATTTAQCAIRGNSCEIFLLGSFLPEFTI